MKMKDRLQPKGIRFHDDAIKNVEADVKKYKGSGMTFSDVVRQIVDKHYIDEAKRNKKKPG